MAKVVLFDNLNRQIELEQAKVVLSEIRRRGPRSVSIQGKAVRIEAGTAPAASDREEVDMSRIVVVESLSLDGVMQAPCLADEDLHGGFRHGGWALPHGEVVRGVPGPSSIADCSISSPKPGDEFCRFAIRVSRTRRLPGVVRIARRPWP
jgi:hypothetical protein